jgi:hypothetical protein
MGKIMVNVRVKVMVMVSVSVRVRVKVRVKVREEIKGGRMKTIVIDRSRYETELHCSRKYYLEYLLGGAGIVPKGTPSYFAVGEAGHVGVQKSMLGYSWPEVQDFMYVPFREPLTADKLPLQGEYLQEQIDLAYALVYVWRKQRMPVFHQEYRVLDLPSGPAVEREINVPIYRNGEYEVVLMSRPDVIVRRTADNAILLWELKTAATANKGWIKKWQHAMQLLLQVKATQHLLQEEGIDKPVVGIVVEGLIKGQRKEDSFGIRRSTSPLIYAYTKKGDGFLIKDQMQTGWKKNWNKELVSYNMPLVDWIDSLPEEILQDCCRVVPPILADADSIQSVCRQVGTRAIQLHEATLTVNGSQEEQVALDTHFQQNFNACDEYDGCAYADCCFMANVGSDPVGSGSFVKRTPNHPLEIALREDSK